MEMNREEAIEYLQDKNEIANNKKIIEKKPVTIKKVKVKKIVTYEEPKFSKVEEQKIEKVMKEGKIYGDPMVVLNE